MFKRKLFYKLLDWKKASARKPLILRGTRQVGKSTLVKDFAKEYEHKIMLNLEKPSDASIFLDLNSTNEIVELLLYRSSISGSEQNVLLFIDEIQQVPQAIAHLRYFYEEHPNFHVIAAGSLLEIVLKDIESFPVGRVEQWVLKPFDFEEFLWAKGDKKLSELLDQIPIPNFAHQLLLNAFHEYVLVGGMPEAVKTYLQKESLVSVKSIYENLWLAYIEDSEKYSNNSTEKKVIRHVFQTAIFEKDRINFAGFGSSNYRSREISEAFTLLGKAGVMNLLYPTTSNQLPLQPSFKRKPRIQLLDTGLLNYLSGWQEQLIGLKDLMGFQSGKIVQHQVIQEHWAQHHSPLFKPMFWVREKSNSNSEVDLLISVKGKVIPVEIKSGTHGRLRSLHQFIDISESEVAIRVLQNKLSLEEVKTPSGTNYKLLNLPYYLSGRLEQYGEWLLTYSSNKNA
ncbi:MAG: ATP-binding protein [Bacteroidetes bacterium]|nr:ATP-binding protein [Bacteroidota bacterium]